MKREKILFAIGLLVLVVVAFTLFTRGKETLPSSPTATPSPTAVPESGGWIIEGAKFLNFNSICGLKLEPSRPKSLTIGGEWTMTGCSTLDEQLGKPLAIVIKIRNSGKTNLNLTVPLLSDVVVHMDTESKAPLAFYLPTSWLPYGGWVTEEKGELIVEMEPGTIVELLYLIPQFSGEAIIDLGSIGSLKIEAPAS